MKAKHCTLIINTSYGYTFSPIEFNSISEAMKYVKEDCGGFAYRIFADGKVVRKGFCS